MEVKESVIVMNTNTWALFSEYAIETASLQTDPIGYLGKFSGLDVVIDEDIPDGMTEIWDKDSYEEFKRGE